MKRNLLKLALSGLMALCAFNLNATDKLPAFPSAEGFGMYTTGGRGGKVYHVTNLNDSGEGSLRWALSQTGPRTIIFDVDGTIHLNSALNIPSNTTIAGQTAPGMGICVADYPFSIKGANVIVRYIRIRLGNKNVLLDGADGWDGFGGFDSRDIIIDHISTSWSIDECFSVYGNFNTTVQWCIAAQSLVNSGHSKGAHGYGAIWGGSGASFHHNLLAHHTSRVPRIGARPTTQEDERVDVRNNVYYNWSGEGCYGFEGVNVNIVNNYYKPGPGTTAALSGSKEYRAKRIAGLGVRTTEYVTNYPAYAPMEHIWGHYYIDGNVNSQYSDVTNDNWTYGVYNQVDAGNCDGTWTQATKDSIKLSAPIPFVHTTTHTADRAYTMVRSYAGCCIGATTNYKKAKAWDAFDTQILNDVNKGIATATGSKLDAGFINTQDDNAALVSSEGSAWPALTAGTALTDTDGDGMPDAWEDSKGLNKNDASDGNATNLSPEGYTNLEVYINGLVEDNITSKLTLMSPTVEGQDDVPASKYDKPSGGDSGEGGGDEPTQNWYSIQNADENVGPNLSITSVPGITATFDEGAWEVGGSQSSARTVDGVNLTGKYATNGTTNGLYVIFTTTQAGTLSIFLGGAVATTKKVEMTEGENGLTGTILSTGVQIESGTAPTADIAQWDAIVYTLEANKTYKFRCTGTKWRLAGYKYIIGTTGINDVTIPGQSKSRIYNLQGQSVKHPQRGIYIRNGKKYVK